MQRFTGKSTIINIATKACYEAANGLRRDFREVSFLKVATKGNNDFVTAADKNSANCISRILLQANPGHGIISEELEIKPSETGFSWIVDPLDGTRNFMHSLSLWGISIGLMKHDPDKILAAVFYDPLRDELFWAEKDKGAFLNDKRIRVSNKISMNNALFATGFTTMPKFEAAQHTAARVRRFGSNTMHLAYLAAGRFDAVWEHVKDIWDIAVGSLLVSEAGGKVTDFSGTENYLKSEYILATNGFLHDVLLEKMKDEPR